MFSFTGVKKTCFYTFKYHFCLCLIKSDLDLVVDQNVLMLEIFLDQNIEDLRLVIIEESFLLINFAKLFRGEYFLTRLLIHVFGLVIWGRGLKTKDDFIKNADCLCFDQLLNQHLLNNKIKLMSNLF